MRLAQYVNQLAPACRYDVCCTAAPQGAQQQLSQNTFSNLICAQGICFIKNRIYRIIRYSGISVIFCNIRRDSARCPFIF